MDYKFLGHRFAARCTKPDCPEAATAQAVFGIVGNAVGTAAPLIGGAVVDRLGPTQRYAIEKRYSLSVSFSKIFDHFAKTGSGQT